MDKPLINSSFHKLDLNHIIVGVPGSGPEDINIEYSPLSNALYIETRPVDGPWFSLSISMDYRNPYDIAATCKNGLLDIKFGDSKPSRSVKVEPRS